jgi:hypothetical protein
MSDRVIVVSYIPPIPATDEIANLHDLFHSNGHLIARARRMGDLTEAARLESLNASTAAEIDALNKTEVK